jgi:hypothetical protein
VVSVIYFWVQINQYHQLACDPWDVGEALFTASITRWTRSHDTPCYAKSASDSDSYWICHDAQLPWRGDIFSAENLHWFPVQSELCGRARHNFMNDKQSRLSSLFQKCISTANHGGIRLRVWTFLKALTWLPSSPHVIMFFWSRADPSVDARVVTRRLKGRATISSLCSRYQSVRISESMITANQSSFCFSEVYLSWNCWLI